MAPTVRMPMAGPVGPTVTRPPRLGMKGAPVAPPANPAAVAPMGPRMPVKGAPMPVSANPGAVARGGPGGMGGVPMKGAPMPVPANPAAVAPMGRPAFKHGGQVRSLKGWGSARKPGGKK